MRRVYARLGALLGPDGALYAYSNNVYLVSDPVIMPIALTPAHAIYLRMGIRIAWGPDKTELVLPIECNPKDFPTHLDSLGEGLPHIVVVFTAWHGVPRHASNDLELTVASLECLGVSHDRLLELVDAVADEDPLAALRLLQVCKIYCFDHIMSSVPPPLL